MEPEGSLLSSQQLVTCPYPESDWTSPYPHIPLLKIHLNIILLSTPASQVVSLPQVSPPKPCMRHPSPPYVLYACPSHSSRFYRRNNIGWGVQTTELLIMHFSPLPCYLVPLRPEYSPQHPILRHPQPTFLPQCGRPNFTPIQNNMQNYSSVYPNL